MSQAEQEELLHFNEGADPSNLVNVLGIMELQFGQVVGLLGLVVLAALAGCSIVNGAQALTLYYYPDAGPGRQAWMCLVYAGILAIAFGIIEKINLCVQYTKKIEQYTKKQKKTTIGTVRQ